ncbi:T9SS type A sorting domain-containing protein [Chryseobacterium sp. RP-3-3]|uniref:T9SS type A sorting domain-containing protein n=1 Tax=Chryseobacterium antibioticum TaxID=2728847 RepID=A0A7Y0FRF6_9FLAO|nr:T9SS type A sorting domain-containing protein [Chryseobacterium antibioticum]
MKGLKCIEWTKIYSSEGKLIQQNSANSKIDVSSLSKGGHFLEIKSQQGLSRHQFIKESY